MVIIFLLYCQCFPEQPASNSRDDYAIRFLNNLFNLMSACNAALNFVLYCALSDKFRKTFMLTFCTRFTHRPSPLHSTGHTAFTDDHSPRMSRASSVHYSRRNSRRLVETARVAEINFNSIIDNVCFKITMLH